MTLASLAKLAPALAKDDGLDVAGWNASPEGKLHPRDHDGQFRKRMGAAVARLAEKFGDVLSQEEFGEPDHPFSHHGVVSAHRSGVSVSSVDEDAELAHIAENLSPANASTLADDIESALSDLESGNYAPGTHFDYDGGGEGQEGDGYPAISFGVMDDGTRYVALTGADGENDIQLNAEHAEHLASVLREQADAVEAEADDDPFRVRPLADGQTLVKRKPFSSSSDFDLVAGLVETPQGHRLRLGITGNDDHPVSKWTGGRGPMVADLGADEAQQLDDALLSAAIELDGYEGALNEVQDLLDEWDETPSGQRMAELHAQGWSLWSSGDRGQNVERHIGNYPDRTVEAAPPEIAAEYMALKAEQDAAISQYDIVDEGETFSEFEVPTSWGTIRIELTGNTLDYDNPAEARITIRPSGVDAEAWNDDVVSMYSAHADYGVKQLRAVRKLVAGYVADSGQPITKSEGAGMSTVYAWAPITKSEKQPDGTLIVYGPASDASLDRDGQRMNQAWLNDAMPRWFSEGGNVREQHDPKRAIGVAVGLTKDDSSGAWMLASHIVDPVAVKKVEAGVLKGYSIGIKEPKLQMGKAEAPNGEVVGGYVCETSLVDRPSNPGMLFCIAKADSAEGGLQPVDHPVVVETEAGETEGEPNPWEQVDEPEPEAPKAERPHLGKRDFSARQRRTAARRGEAMPDGSFPIANEGDLKNAIHLVGNAKDPAAARRHIVARARALGLVSQLPEDWGISKADAVIAALAPILQLDELHKYDEAADITNAEKAMALIARLIASEAAELAKGRMEEAEDIRILLDAHKALDYFRCREQNQAGQGDGTAPVDGAYTPSDVDMTKDSPAMGYEKTENPDLVKAVAEATAAKERAKDLETQVAQLKSQMAAMPAPGGPVLTKTATAVRTTTDNNQRRAEADWLLAKADHTPDPTLRKGYRDRAAELLKADA